MPTGAVCDGSFPCSPSERKSYSFRNAAMGLTRAARTAGRAPAQSPVIREDAMATTTIGICSVTGNSPTDHGVRVLEGRQHGNQTNRDRSARQRRQSARARAGRSPKDIECRSNRHQRRRHAALHRVPHNPVVERIVRVRKPSPKAREVAPRHLEKTRAHAFWHALGRFAMISRFRRVASYRSSFATNSSNEQLAV